MKVCIDQVLLGKALAPDQVKSATGFTDRPPYTLYLN